MGSDISYTGAMCVIGYRTFRANKHVINMCKAATLALFKDQRKLFYALFIADTRRDKGRPEALPVKVFCVFCEQNMHGRRRRVNLSKPSSYVSQRWALSLKVGA